MDETETGHEFLDDDAARLYKIMRVDANVTQHEAFVSIELLVTNVLLRSLTSLGQMSPLYQTCDRASKGKTAPCLSYRYGPPLLFSSTSRRWISD